MRGVRRQRSSRGLPPSARRKIDGGLAAAVGLLLLSPLFCLIALWIKLTSPGPVFYRARRVGKHGVLFSLYKFRSMVVNADRRGPGITAAGDARITPAGRFLRRARLDELPQLLNVLKGEMSLVLPAPGPQAQVSAACPERSRRVEGLVGPWPEDPRYVAHYMPEQRQVLAVRPGITSAASLAYRHEEQVLSGVD